jgi:hypothetical protein
MHRHAISRASSHGGPAFNKHHAMAFNIDKTHQDMALNIEPNTSRHDTQLKKKSWHSGIK